MSAPSVIKNAYGDIQLVGDITSIPFDDAIVLLKSVVESAERGVWLRLPYSEAGVKLISAAWDLGFTRAHSARDNFVTLQCWRQAGPNPTPTDAFTDIGSAAIVVDARSRILSIRERFDRSGRWQFPGGHVDAGECFIAAAVREAWEETGVRCVPIGVVSQRHFPCLPPAVSPSPLLTPARIAAGEQSARFGSANLGVFVLCHAVGGDTEGGLPLTFDDAEVTEACWLSAAEFCDGSSDTMAVLVRCVEVRAPA